MTELAEIFETTKAAVKRGKRAKWWQRAGKTKKSFRYLTADGNKVTDEQQLQRIEALRIPPAWREVRISPSKNSSLQAIGIDALGRIQYLYHAKFSEKRKAQKFKKIVRFGEFLPALRRLTNEHIALEGFPRERVLAVIVRLINDLYFRVGSEESVSRYKTFGVTTLRNKHIRIDETGKLQFNFIGKHHIRQQHILMDDDLTLILQDLKKIGGSRLFNYFDDEKRPRSVKPGDINSYIKAATASDFSAKDLRTWGATLKAAVYLAEMGKPETGKQAQKDILAAAKKVAEHLGNTPTVCRSSYIHPLIFKAYQEGIILDEFRPRQNRRVSRLEPEYLPEEIALMKMFGKLAE